LKIPNTSTTEGHIYSLFDLFFCFFNETQQLGIARNFYKENGIEN
jgi:hypothetical protein